MSACRAGLLGRLLLSKCHRHGGAAEARDDGRILLFLRDEADQLVVKPVTTGVVLTVLFARLRVWVGLLSGEGHDDGRLERLVVDREGAGWRYVGVGAVREAGLSFERHQ